MGIDNEVFDARPANKSRPQFFVQRQCVPNARLADMISAISALLARAA
jgi:hypothetical protein